MVLFFGGPVVELFFYQFCCSIPEPATVLRRPHKCWWLEGQVLGLPLQQWHDCLGLCVCKLWDQLIQCMHAPCWEFDFCCIESVYSLGKSWEVNSAASLRHKDYVSLTGCRADYQLIQAGCLFSRLPGVRVPSFPILVDLTLKCGNERDTDQLQSVTVPGMTESSQ